MDEEALSGHVRSPTLLTDTVRGFLRDVAGAALTRGVGVVAGIVTLTATTRLLGPEGRGQFSVALACLGLVLQFGPFGLHAASTYLLARTPDARSTVTGLLSTYAFVGISVLAAAGALAVTAVPSLVPNVPPVIVGLALAVAPPAMFVTLAGSVWLGLGRPALYNAFDLAGKGAGLASVALLVWWPMPAFFLAYAGLHYLIALVAYVSLVGWTRPVFDRRVNRDLFSFGSRMFLSNAFLFLLLRLDLFLVNAWLGADQAGQYSVALQMSELLLLATSSVSAMLFPRLAAMTAEARWRATWRAMRWVAAGLGGAVLGLAAVGESVFTLAFGPSFADAVRPFWLLLPGLWCLALSGILTQYLAAGGMPWTPVAVTGAAVGLNLLMNTALIPRHGIDGAAVASSLTYLLLLLFAVGYVRFHRVQLPSDPRSDAGAS